MPVTIGSIKKTQRALHKIQIMFPNADVHSLAAPTRNNAGSAFGVLVRLMA